MQKRFRLTLQFIEAYKVPFQIEFFTLAIESNAYPIAFWLLMNYEEQIFQNDYKSVDAHIYSYQKNL